MALADPQQVERTPDPLPVVLVIGASSGIGRAVALRFAERGARLVLLARSAGRLEDVRAECLARGSKAEVVVADVLDADAMHAAVDSAVRRHGRLDVCVHSAAVVAYGRLEEVPAEIWDRAITTGILGTANVARAVLPQLQEQHGGGSLVVVGSVLGEVATPFMSSYITAKWGIHGLTRSLQQEARSTPGVHIALVKPGAIDTQIYTVAATYSGHHGSPPPPVAGTGKVVDAVFSALEHRRREVDAGIANRVMRLGFRLTPWAYDRLVTPLMKVGGMQWRRTAPTPGNVLIPSEAVRAAD